MPKKEGLKIIDYYKDTGESLKEKMEKSAVFLVLANEGFINGVKSNYDGVFEPTKVAKELSKDTVVMIDKRLSEDDRKLLKEHLSGLKIVREEVFDTRDFKLIARILVEIHNVYEVEER